MIAGNDLVVTEDAGASTTKKATKADFLKDAATYMNDTSVTTSKISNEAITSAKLATGAGQPGGAWTSWTPTLSGRLNNSKWTKDCKYTQIGKTVHFKFFIIANTTTPMDGGSADAVFTLPVAAATVSAAIPTIGSVGILDAGTARFTGFVEYHSAATARVRYIDTAGSVGGDMQITSILPFAWTTSDEIFCTGTYEAA